MMDAIDCPACGQNADACRCPGEPRGLRWAHTSAMVREDEGDPLPPFTADQVMAYLAWAAEAPIPFGMCTRDAAGRLTLRTP